MVRATVSSAISQYLRGQAAMYRAWLRDGMEVSAGLYAMHQDTIQGGLIKMKNELLQFGNFKLPKTTGIFNLPRVKTCPGRTSFCMQHCYAKKAERQYKTAAAYRERMYQLSTAQDFVQVMTGYITKKIASRGLDTIRIHEAGDFYDQVYLDKWIAIAQALPLVTFYAYTKSFKLDFSKRPANMIVRGSVDPTTKTLDVMAAEKLDGTAETQIPGVNLGIANNFECPGSCKTCSYCLKPGNVWFHLH